jgi:two-component system cell cycle response regulator
VNYDDSPQRRATDRREDAPETVLVVDDSRAIRTILTRTLREAGYQVAEAADGREGLEKCREILPNLVLLDIDMPVMDGIETIKSMRADPQLEAIPVLFLTARTGSEDAALGLKLGARDYVRKPCEPAELIARVSTTLRLHAQEMELMRRAEQLDDLSNTDQLTGLGNRRRLRSLLNELEQQGGAEAPIGAILMDLDLFKAVNDTHGHLIGDVVLRAVAGRLVNVGGSAATVVRWGGEEFLVVLPDLTGKELLNMGERLRMSIGSAPIAVGLDVGLNITISAGCCSGTVADFESSVESADMALYESKRLGRNRVTMANGNARLG